MTNSMPHPQPLDDSGVLLHAYIDGELAPVDALAMEQRIAADPTLAAKRNKLLALRNLIDEHLPRETISSEFRAQIERSIGLRRETAQPSWRAMAASIALVAIVSSGSTWLLIGPQHSRSTEDAIVADHIRALMAPQPADVASTDQHTVKPWFNGRVPQAPRVIDLATAGFPLIGGRIDVVGRNPVPTLVYRIRKHVISLTAIPAPGTQNAEPALSTNDGYNIVRWFADGVSYWAISDVTPTDLEEFAKLFRGVHS